MIPSDHFVRFYNEVFKYLEKRNALEDYYLAVSRHQEIHCLKLFREKGFLGMEEYWNHIRVEENCVGYHEFDEFCYHSHMKRCPSLSKVLDNDAEPCRVYCDHCFGWVAPLMLKAGFQVVYNLIGRDAPECEMFLYKDRDAAVRKYRELLSTHPEDPTLIKTTAKEFSNECS